MKMKRTIRIISTENKTRLDKYASQNAPDISRSRLKSLIEKGHLFVNGASITDPSYNLRKGDKIRLDIPEAEEADPIPQKMDLDIVYEDPDLLVIHKPAGLVVHPGAGNADKTLVNALLAHCGDELSGIGGVKRPGIVHRLDKDTSGLMVVAKNDKAHHGLSAQFSDRTLSRTYVALVWGVPFPPEGVIQNNIGRSPQNRKKMAVLRSGGREAVTEYRVLESYKTYASLVECRLKTGRTHQIRVHLTDLGYPLIGDPVYGRSPSWLKNKSFEAIKEFLATKHQQALHAYKLKFIHPISGKETEFETGFPEYFKELIKLLNKL